MEFRVLGPLEATDAGTPLALGPRKQRALLARLLLDAGRTVAVERLLDDLWGERLPDSAPKMVQIYVSGLRKVLPPGALETRPPGYVLHLEPDGCDLVRFERLALEGRAALEGGDPATAADRLGQALALWRGPALAEFDTEPFADVESMRLEELRLAATEERIEAELALGHHAAVIGDLEALVRRNPLRERPHAQLILALYRAGRQAEALSAYQVFRARLDDELGIEPSPALKALERSVLLQDPDLVRAAPATVPAPVPVVRQVADLPGRERELGRLAAALESVRAGRRRVVVLSGPPGIGKHSVVDTFLAGLDDALVARAQAVGGGAYAPVLDALAMLADDDAVADTLVTRAPAWVAHLPWLAGRGGETHGVTAERMVRQLLDALEHVAAERTLVVALEDLEGADTATTDLLRALVQRRAPSRMLVLLTYAPGADAEPLARDLRQLCLEGHADLLPLGSLDLAAVGRRLAQRFPAAPPPPEVAELLWERAGGNPLLDRLLVEHWVATGLVSGEGGAFELRGTFEQLRAGVPAGLTGMLADRVALLDPADAEVARAAAVAGARATPVVVAAATGRSIADVEARLARVRPLLEHPLTREAVRGSLDAAQRQRLHLRVGEALEDGADPGDAARHLLEGGDPGRAARLLRQAADAALARRAYEDGIPYLRTALEAAATLPDGPERRRLEVELGARLGQALVAVSGWSAPAAEAALSRARALARHTRDNELLVSVSLALATLWEVRGETEAALKAANEALAIVDGGDGPHLDAHELLACAHFHQGGFERALQHAEVGAGLFDPDEPDAGHFESFPATLGDNAGVACHDWAALAAWFLGAPDTALERARHAVELAREPGRTYALAPALTQLTVVHQLRREPVDVLREAEATIIAARDRGYAYRTAMGRVLRGWALSMQGAADEGLTEIVGGIAAARATGAHMEDPYFLALLADAQLEVGDVTAGLRAADEGLRVARRERSNFCDPELHRLRAGLRRAGGAEARTVEAELVEALAIARRQGSRVLELRVAVDLASLQREEGLPADGPRLVAEVYEMFTEGFDTPDLREAAALMRTRAAG